MDPPSVDDPKKAPKRAFWSNPFAWVTEHCLPPLETLAIPAAILTSDGAVGRRHLVMRKTPDRQRNTASAATLLWNSIAGSVATAGCGVLFARFGYPGCSSALPLWH
jgi:hypothetical protein